jgi:hypothetical protein
MPAVDLWSWLLASAAQSRRTMTEHTTGGQMSLAQLAAQHHTQPATILRMTAQHSPGGAFPANVSEYINGVFTGAISHDQHMCPRGYGSTCPSNLTPGAPLP